MDGYAWPKVGRTGREIYDDRAGMEGGLIGGIAGEGVLTAAGGCPGESSGSRSQERDTCGYVRLCGCGCALRGDRWL